MVERKGKEIKVKCPECDKIGAAHDKSMVLSEFLDWLEEKGYKICVPTEAKNVLDRLTGRKETWATEDVDMWYPLQISPEKILANYFEIDLDKAEEERQALLDAIRC